MKTVPCLRICEQNVWVEQCRLARGWRKRNQRTDQGFMTRRRVGACLIILVFYPFLSFFLFLSFLPALSLSLSPSLASLFLRPLGPNADVFLDASGKRPRLVCFYFILF